MQIQVTASAEINTSAVKSTEEKATMSAPTPKSGNLTPRSTATGQPTVSKSSASNNSSTSSPQKTRPPAASHQHQQQYKPAASTYTTPSIRKHEEFKNQLVHDVFERDNKGRVPMEKVAMLIWQFRDDPAVVQFMAQFVAKVRLCLEFLYWHAFFSVSAWSSQTLELC